MLRKAARVLRWIVDLAVVVAVIACILHYSRRKSVVCAWERMRASCTVEVEDSLGRIEHETIDGIRGAAYRSRGVVGLVTDAQNKDEHALFGTREIELEDEGEAEHLRAFAADRVPERVVLGTGVMHPRWTTAGLLFALAFYAYATRRARSGLARRDA